MALRRLTRCLFPFTQQANATPPHDLNELELSDANDNTISVWVATPDLTVISFTATNPEAIKGSWAVYNDTDYQGTPIIINPDSAVARSEVVEPLFTNSNTIQSVKPLIGQIILYKNFNYTGDSLVLTESTPIWMERHSLFCTRHLRQVGTVSGDQLSIKPQHHFWRPRSTLPHTWYTKRLPILREVHT